jgi:hypothetical protein
MAEEKKQKMRLIQELENIKDKFAELNKVMKKLELDESLDRAIDFLTEQVALSYYGVLYCLGQI